MKLTIEAVRSLEWVRDYIQSNGKLPAMNLTDFELSKYYSEFGYPTEESFRRALMTSPFLAAIKMVLHRDTLSL